MQKFESLQEESRAQSVDSSEAYRKPRAFNVVRYCCFITQVYIYNFLAVEIFKLVERGPAIHFYSNPTSLDLRCLQL